MYNSMMSKCLKLNPNQSITNLSNLFRYSRREIYESRFNRIEGVCICLNVMVPHEDDRFHFSPLEFLWPLQVPHG